MILSQFINHMPDGKHRMVMVMAVNPDHVAYGDFLSFDAGFHDTMIL
jgi:hypothetical protein